MIYGDGSSKAGMMNPGSTQLYGKTADTPDAGPFLVGSEHRSHVEKYPGEQYRKRDRTLLKPSACTRIRPNGLQVTCSQLACGHRLRKRSPLSPTRRSVTVTVALADDLTGREKHEVAPTRPPRVTKTYSLDASGTVKFRLYGGLIYIKGNSSTNESASFTFTGVVKAPFYKDGAWKNDRTPLPRWANWSLPRSSIPHRRIRMPAITLADWSNSLTIWIPLPAR